MTSRGILIGGRPDSAGWLSLDRQSNVKRTEVVAFFSWLFRQTPRQTDPVPQSGTFQPFNLEGLARSDRLERTTQRFERENPAYGTRSAAPRQPTPVRLTATLIKLPDVFCMIEYCDAEGITTRRRVTLKALDYAASPLIKAYCHERRAPRTFKLDRVVSFISEDGEIIDPARYCSSALGLEVAGPAFHQPGNIASVRSLMAAIHTPMTILVAVARADGNFATSEIDRIEAALERDLADLAADKRRKIDMQLVLDGHLAKVIKDCRPTQESVQASAKKLVEWPAVRIDRLSRGLSEVIRADGLVHASEVDALASIASFAREGRYSRLSFVLKDIQSSAEWNGK